MAEQIRNREFVGSRRHDGADKQLMERQRFGSRNLIVERIGVALVMKNPAKVSPAIDANPMSIISEVRSMVHSRSYAAASEQCRAINRESSRNQHSSTISG